MSRQLESSFDYQLNWVEAIPGLFHGEMHVLRLLLLAHSGPKPRPLYKFFMGFISRKRSMWDESSGNIKDFRACDEFFRHIHTAHVLAAVAAVENVDDWNSLHDKLKTINWRKTIHSVWKRFGNPVMVYAIRSDEEVTSRDTVFENAILLFQHGIIYREFSQAMKDGDTGRVEECLLFINIIFQGTKLHNYKFEFLNLLTSLRHRWSEGLRRFWLENSLLNLSGTRGAWLADDQVCEHVVRETKNELPSSHTPANKKFMYETAARQVLIAMESRDTIYRDCGAAEHYKHSSIARDDVDVRKLTELLMDRQVFIKQPGRTSAFGTETEGIKCVDLFGKGLEVFTSGKPLGDFLDTLKSGDEQELMDTDDSMEDEDEE